MLLFLMPIDYVLFCSLIAFAILFNPIGQGREDNKLMKQMKGYK